MRTTSGIAGGRKWRWLLGLSAFDACATDAGLRFHVIGEANPLAAYLYDTHVVLFYAFKLLLPLALLAIHRRLRFNSFIQRAGTIALLLYGLVALYHIGWILYAVLRLE